MHRAVLLATALVAVLGLLALCLLAAQSQPSNENIFRKSPRLKPTPTSHSPSWYLEFSGKQHVELDLVLSRSALEMLRRYFEVISTEKSTLHVRLTLEANITNCKAAYLHDRDSNTTYFCLSVSKLVQYSMLSAHGLTSSVNKSTMLYARDLRVCLELNFETKTYNMCYSAHNLTIVSAQDSHRLTISSGYVLRCSRGPISERGHPVFTQSEFIFANISRMLINTSRQIVTALASNLMYREAHSAVRPGARCFSISTVVNVTRFLHTGSSSIRMLDEVVQLVRLLRLDLIRVRGVVCLEDKTGRIVFANISISNVDKALADFRAHYRVELSKQYRLESSNEKTSHRVHVLWRFGRSLVKTGPPMSYDYARVLDWKARTSYLVLPYLSFSELHYLLHSVAVATSLAS